MQPMKPAVSLGRMTVSRPSSNFILIDSSVETQLSFHESILTGMERKRPAFIPKSTFQMCFIACIKLFQRHNLTIFVDPVK